MDTEAEKDLKFSDGSPLTAKDVAFTYNNAAAGGGKIDMGNFAKAEEIDPLTVKITLSEPQSTFINVLGSLGIVSADKYDARQYAQNRWVRAVPPGGFPAGPAADC